MLQFWKGFRYTTLILGTMTSPKAGRTLRNSLRRWTRSKHIRRLKTILCFCLILPRIILRLDTIDSESMVSFLLLFYLPIGTNKLAVTFPDCLKTWQSGISPLIEDKSLISVDLMNKIRHAIYKGSFMLLMIIYCSTVQLLYSFY